MSDNFGKPNESESGWDDLFANESATWGKTAPTASAAQDAGVAGGSEADAPYAPPVKSAWGDDAGDRPKPSIDDLIGKPAATPTPPAPPSSQPATPGNVQRQRPKVGERDERGFIYLGNPSEQDGGDWIKQVRGGQAQLDDLAAHEETMRRHRERMAAVFPDGRPAMPRFAGGDTANPEDLIPVPPANRGDEVLHQGPPPMPGGPEKKDSFWNDSTPIDPKDEEKAQPFLKESGWPDEDKEDKATGWL